MVLGEVRVLAIGRSVRTPTSMRPRVGSRGSHEGLRGRQREVRTSMRPRVGSRGSIQAGQSSARTSLTSMRPRVGSRGSAGSRSGPPGSGRDFNEAPSWFSGKWHRQASEEARRGHFNEAPSWFSGKWRRDFHDARCRRGTSMRPRVGSRGSRFIAALNCRLSAVLQ